MITNEETARRRARAMAAYRAANVRVGLPADHGLRSPADLAADMRTGGFGAGGLANMGTADLCVASAHLRRFLPRLLWR
jgi:hypothetical protein